MGCVAIDGNAKVKVRWARFQRALKAVQEVCMSRNSDVLEDSEQERDMVIDFDH